MGRQALLAAGMRGRIITLRDDLWKGKPYKPLTFGKRSTGGRNNTGRSDSLTTAPSPFTIRGMQAFMRGMCAAHVVRCEKTTSDLQLSLLNIGSEHKAVVCFDAQNNCVAPGRRS